MLRGFATAAFAVCAIAQFVLYWQILAEHKPGHSRASFALMKIPRKDDLTARGQRLQKWWWWTTAGAVAAFLGVVASRG